MTFTTHTAPRALERIVGADALAVVIDGTAYPWSQHTELTIGRGATMESPTTRPATLSVTLAGEAATAAALGRWVSVEYTTQTALADASTPAARHRFVGRITDLTLSRPSVGSLARTTCTAAGTIRELDREVWASVDTVRSSHTVLSTLVAQVAGYMVPPPARAGGYPWGLVNDLPAPGPDLAVHSGQWTPAVTVAQGVTAGRAGDGALLAEHRDGSLHIKPAAAGALVLAADEVDSRLEFDYRQPVNRATVTYGPDPMPGGYVYATQLVTNPSARTATTGWAVYNGTLTRTASGSVQLKPSSSTSPATGYVTVAYTPALGTLWLRPVYTLNKVTGGTSADVQVRCDDAGGTMLELVTLPGTSRGLEPGVSTLPYLESSVLYTPPAGTATVSVRVQIAAGPAAGSVPCVLHRFSVIGLGVVTNATDPTGQDIYPWLHDFDGAGPWVLPGFLAAETGCAYVWTGTANASTSTCVSVPGGPRPFVISEDRPSIDAVGLKTTEQTTQLDSQAAAAALAALLIDPGGWDPAPLAVDVLDLIRRGRTAQAAAVLSVELGDRVRVAGIPATLPQVGAGPNVYVSGIDEHITPGGWSIRFTLATRPP